MSSSPTSYVFNSFFRLGATLPNDRSISVQVSISSGNSVLFVRSNFFTMTRVLQCKSNCTCFSLLS